ncbi:uncharacterized protein LOC109710589 isoform X2 [Ananas comosus]|nr:uncharacterized protein LOC109710589 isoform X2 [Ananas comosus]OAY85132.1 hypothetical protein ACMD2_04035 [Ananas comosus]
MAEDAVIKPSNSMIDDGNWDEDDEWVVVTKQRITILIPPPSPQHPQVESVVRRRNQSKRTKNSRGSSLTPKRTNHKQSKNGSDAEINGGSSKKNSFLNPFGDRAKNSGVVPNYQANCSGHAVQKGNLGFQRNVRKGRSLKVEGISLRLPICHSNIANRRLRAMMLERKLRGLGGLRKWLESKGLCRFIRLFEREKIGMYQLVSLSMSKLKDMGAYAVGPRRKLIHAIGSLCEPYHF